MAWNGLGRAFATRAARLWAKADYGQLSAAMTPIPLIHRHKQPASTSIAAAIVLIVAMGVSHRDDPAV